MSESHVDFHPAPGMSTDQTDERKYYYCPERNASFIRYDGVKLTFTTFVFGSNVKGDQQYLDGEIAAKHPSLRYATSDEILSYRMATDAVGAIREQLVAEERDTIIASARDGIEKEVLARISEQLGAVVADNGDFLGEDGKKLATTDVTDRLRKLMLRSGSGTVTLGGIVGSDSVKEAAVSSGV